MFYYKSSRNVRARERERERRRLESPAEDSYAASDGGGGKNISTFTTTARHHHQILQEKFTHIHTRGDITTDYNNKHIAMKAERV